MMIESFFSVVISLLSSQISSQRLVRSLVRSNTSDGPPDPPSKLHILWHDGDPLGVDCTQVGVL